MTGHHVSDAVDIDAVREALIAEFADVGRGDQITVLVPDHTRTAPLPVLLPILCEALAEASTVRVIVALGTHPPLPPGQLADLLGLTDLQPATPQRLHRGLSVANHAWRDPEELRSLGIMSEAEIRAVAGSRWHRSLSGDLPLRVNRAVLEADRVVILGPVFPHEVVGFSGGAKYLFPGVSGPEMIDVSHWLGALCGIRDTIGVIDTPVRDLIHRAARRVPTPLTLVALVVAPDGALDEVFTGDLEPTWRRAAESSSRRHIIWHDRPMRRVLSIAPPMYDELWTAAKAAYKIEPVLADGAELIIHAPHLSRISEAHGADLAGIGYHSLEYFLHDWDRFAAVPRAVLAHSTHLRGDATMVDGLERPRTSIVLSSRIPEAVCSAHGLGYRDPDTIDLSSWVDREDEGVMLVPRAGEILHRPRPGAK